MAKLSSFAHDVEKGEKGVWIKGVLDNINLKIADGENKAYFNKLKELGKPYRHSPNGIPDEKWEEIQNQALAEFVLLDWQNIEDDVGQMIPYSKQKALELLSDPVNKEFRKLVIKLSDERELFRKQAVADISDKSE